MFQKAVTIRKRIKALFYGGPGTGKTTCGLTFPNVAAVDGEKGTIPYDQQFAFHVEHTTSFLKLVEILKWMKAEGQKKFETLLIDPITVFYQDLVALIGEKRRARSGKDAGLAHKDWGTIKMAWKTMLNQLIDLDMHVVLVCREKPEYEETATGDLKKVGVMPEVDGSTGYLADFAIEFRFDKKKKRFYAMVDKSRYRILKQGTEIEQPTFKSVFGKVVAQTDAGEHLLSEDSSKEILPAEKESLAGGQIPPSSLDRAVAQGVGNVLQEYFTGTEEFDENDNGMKYVTPVSEADLKRIFTLGTQLRWSGPGEKGGKTLHSDDLKRLIYRRYKIESTKDLSVGDMEDLEEKIGLCAAGHLVLKRTGDGTPYFAKAVTEAIPKDMPFRE